MMRFGYGGFGGFGACGPIGGGLAGGGFFMMLISVILIAVIIFAVFKFRDNSRVKYGREADNAMEILNERFARGEVSEEEYRQKKALLHGR